MFGPKELDIKNVYTPDLQNIQESAERTYGEANSFFRKEELYLLDIERRLNNGTLTDPKDIYDECHAIAADLAKCCEMYLKALYIYENNIPGNEIDSIWNKLKNFEYQSDSMGNLIYKTSSGVITFVKYDENGAPLVDENGKKIYFDKFGNVYNDNNRGSKIKRNGHQLDRLIELLSPESRLYLETRMLSIPMSETEKNGSISIIDVLQNKGVLDTEEHITKEQYESWIEQHKKTFEESRYSGEKKYDVNIEFLHHLANQIKAVAQYKIEPKSDQIFTITDEEISKLPIEIQKIASYNRNIISEKLIKILAANDEIKKKITLLFSKKFFLPNDIKSETFCKMIEVMNVNEIFYTSYISYIASNFDRLKDKSQDNLQLDKMLRITNILIRHGLTPVKIIAFFCQLKIIFKGKFIINNQNLMILLNIATSQISHSNNYFGYINKYEYNNDLIYNLRKI